MDVVGFPFVNPTYKIGDRTINREIKDRQGEAASLGSLGLAYRSLGQYPKAIDFYQQSLAIQQKIGDRTVGNQPDMIQLLSV
ncbi:tetratricopeptide repeat protein [Microcystis sp. LE18-22.4A]|jgi:tetratricopeptide (TPR) repeat protein|uniref:tetratricopeptide repeat protein n=1 Tax=Microcystis sp. LE18-22.4A TaxID=3016432 RepID=UPI00339026EE